MNEMELTAVIQGAGWTVHKRNKQSRKVYIYAAKKIGGKVKEVYIAPLHRLGSLTEQDIEAIKNKLQK